MNPPTTTRAREGLQEQLSITTVPIRTDADWSRLAPPTVYCRARPRRSQVEYDLPVRQILLGDALSQMQTLPADSVDCVVTSPPYYLLRDYHASGQLGLEASVTEYVEHVVAVCDEVARILKPSGALWLNLGDSYSRHARYGGSAKTMLLAPERVLLGLVEHGWIVRNKIVWAKPNPMPTSVRDRLNTAWEPIYFLVRSPHYYFDLDAIREPHRSTRRREDHPHPGKYEQKRPHWAGPLAGANDGLLRARAEGRAGHPKGKNPGDVWTYSTAGYRGAHFATFPARLLTKPILATCPERVCTNCGQPWSRRNGELAAPCGCRAEHAPGVVLDPFIGAGTTAIAAEAQGRDWIGVELNPGFRDLAMARIEHSREEVKQLTKKGTT